MKNERQKAVLNIISGNYVDTQEELTRLLKEAGYNVTQATVSRDIKELHLVKIQGHDGRSRYVHRQPNSPMNNYRMMLKSSIISVNFAMNDVVVKCYSGTAPAAAAAIDSMDISEIMGTVSGDDTILIIASSEKDAEKLSHFFRDFIDK